MKDRLQHLEAGRESIRFFETLPWADRTRVNFANVRGVQFLEPLFEFSGACAGCGETPYLKLMSQLFGDRLQIANATGCSSIYGGNLPTTPWAANADGRGPAWANSLFEDNAEFGLGYRLAIDSQTAQARALAEKLAPLVGGDLVSAILQAPQVTESDFRVQRQRVAALKAALAGATDPDAANLLALADFLVRRSVWIVGGDGWAYDIDYGGLDHVLASGKDVNIIVLDTEVYSNTGGQASKATPLGAIGEVRGRGQGDATQGPGADGHRLRQRLRRPDRHGGEQRAGARGDARGGGLPRNVADPGVLAVHRPRHRHAPRHEAGGARRGLRLLAAVPLRSDDAGTGHEPVPARLAAAAHSARGIPLQRGALQVAGADAPGRRETDARRGAARPRGTLPRVRGSGDARRQPVPTRTSTS